MTCRSLGLGIHGGGRENGVARGLRGRTRVLIRMSGHGVMARLVQTDNEEDHSIRGGCIWVRCTRSTDCFAVNSLCSRPTSLDGCAPRRNAHPLAAVLGTPNQTSFSNPYHPLLRRAVLGKLTRRSSIHPPPISHLRYQVHFSGTERVL